jgi:hypothetical protein
LIYSKDFESTFKSSKDFIAASKLASALFDSNTTFVTISNKTSFKNQQFLFFEFSYGTSFISGATMTVGAMEGTCFMDGDISFTVYASGLSHIFNFE